MYCHGHYVLIGQSPVQEPDFIRWAMWFEHADRRVALTQLPWCVVSTVFLGLDHGFNYSDPTAPPILFESMAFWDGGSDEQDRCATWLEAEAMHAKMVQDASVPARVAAHLWRSMVVTIREALHDLRECCRAEP